MAKERYNVSIKCPNCGQSGILKVSENDYPFMRRLDRDVRCTEGEFDAAMVNDQDAKIMCKQCEQEFKW
jgi:ssDNA-binding Zn-finger/Zn-ribbon topoisomerase 1